MATLFTSVYTVVLCAELQAPQQNAGGDVDNVNRNTNNNNNNRAPGLDPAAIVDIDNLLQDIQDVEGDEFPFVE